MAQARRIKKKPAAKKKNSKGRNIPWGLLLVVLVTGAVLGKLLLGANRGDSNFGAGLKTLFESQTAVRDDDTQAIQELVAKSTEKEFEFYEVLPDIEQIMPDDIPESTQTRQRDDLDYYVQAASFRKHADAEKLRARLALKNFKSFTQARTSEEKGTYYRVRLGPYGNKREAKTIKNKLQKLGVRPIVISLKKNKNAG